MATNTARMLHATARLREALDQTARGLAEARLDVLLTGEAALEVAVAELPAMCAVDADERQAIRSEIAATRLALVRCRRLGAVLGEFVQGRFAGQADAVGYGAPDRPAPALSGRQFQTRA